MESEKVRQRKVNAILKEVKERREKAKKYREYQKQILKDDVEYLRTWIRMPIGKHNSQKSKNLRFWSIKE